MSDDIKKPINLLESNIKLDATNQLDKLFLALSKAQSKLSTAKKDKDNPFFKSSYADLASCWDAIRQPLSDNNLSIIQMPMEGVATLKLRTILGHSSGQWISSVTEIKPSKLDPQGTGSAMTYARRYGLMAICGIAPDDDDGNAASNPKPQNNKPQPKSNNISPAAQSYNDLIYNNDNADELNAFLDERDPRPDLEKPKPQKLTVIQEIALIVGNKNLTDKMPEIISRVTSGRVDNSRDLTEKEKQLLLDYLKLRESQIG